jgi:hypothetical protein
MRRSKTVPCPPNREATTYAKTSASVAKIPSRIQVLARLRITKSSARRLPLTTPHPLASARGRSSPANPAPGEAPRRRYQRAQLQGWDGVAGTRRPARATETYHRTLRAGFRRLDRDLVSARTRSVARDRFASGFGVIGAAHWQRARRRRHSAASPLRRCTRPARARRRGARPHRRRPEFRVAHTSVSPGRRGTA